MIAKMAFMCRLISYIYPARNKDLLEQLQQKHMTVMGERQVLSAQ